MKKILFTATLLLCTAFLFLACAPRKVVTETPQTSNTSQVSFTEMQNYTCIDPSLPMHNIITSEAEFNKSFTPTPAKGKGGKPTKIDFRRQFVIAVVLPPTNIPTRLILQGFSLKGEMLDFAYSQEEGDRPSETTMIPLLLVALDRSYLTNQFSFSHAYPTRRETPRSRQ